MAVALYAYAEEWRLAVTLMAIWIPLLFLTRWKRLYVDAKDQLNEFENV